MNKLPKIHFKTTEADSDRECLQILGASSVPTICLGHLILLELLNNPLLTSDIDSINRETLIEAAYIIYRGKAAAENARRITAGLDDEFLTDLELPEDIAAITDDIDALHRLSLLIRRSIDDSLAGFDMIHKRPDHNNTTKRAKSATTPSTRTFATPEYITSIASILSSTGAVQFTLDQLLWELPMTYISHQIASACASTADIYRPRDSEKTKAEFQKFKKAKAGNK